MAVTHQLLNLLIKEPFLPCRTVIQIQESKEDLSVANRLFVVTHLL